MELLRILNLPQAEPGLSLVQEREDPQIYSSTSPLDTSGVPDANIIIRSSDLVNFRVHKSVLAMASPFFKDLLSLPQPPDGEFIDGLPVVQLSEDSNLLSTLVSMLYPLRPVTPKSYEKVLYSLAIFSAVVPNPCHKVLYLLAACQKYEMAEIQSSIRAKVSQGEFPAPEGAEAFSAYVIASHKGLTLETEKAARQTLDYPMTFDVLGEGLRLFEGWALRDLANFRKRYRDNLVSCFKSFIKPKESQFKIWTYCGYNYSGYNHSGSSLPTWLAEIYQKHLNESQEAFSKSLFNPQSIREEYLSAQLAHFNTYLCNTCVATHMQKGGTFCKDLEDRLTQALDEVCPSIFGSC